MRLPIPKGLIICTKGPSCVDFTRADALVDCLTVNNHLALMNLQMNNMDSERLEKIVTSLMLNGQVFGPFP